MNDSNKPAAKPHVSAFSKAMNVLVYPIAAIPGYLYSRVYIRRNAYKNLAKHHVFDHLRPAENAGIQAIFGLADAEINKNDPKIKGLLESISKPENCANEIAKVHEEFRLGVKQIFENKKMTNVMHYWKCLHSNQKWEAVIQGLAVTGIGLGAMFSIFQNRDLSRRLEEIEAKQDQQERTR